MKKTGLSLLFMLAFAVLAHAQKDAKKPRKPRAKTAITNHKDSVSRIKTGAKPVSDTAIVKKAYPPWDTALCFPLSADKLYNVYDFVIYLDDERVVNRYKPYFDKYEYKYSGYVWEAIIKEMLANADKDLSNNIVIRSETNAVMINITKYQNVKKFPDYMCPIFSNLTRFSDYLKNANRSLVPNY